MVDDSNRSDALTHWIESFARAGELDSESREAITKAVRLVRLAPGAHVFDPGSECRFFILVATGTIRVRLIAESGREILLYRVAAGETCVLTTSCLLHSDVYAAQAVCETEVTALLLPASTFNTLLGRSEGFRRAVLRAYADRVSDLILTLEETSFRRLDVRLAAALLARARDDHVTVTHQELALELGSAREVISRSLKRFERQAMVRLARGVITITNRQGLETVAKAM
jgi:CRP/FNR family transcriptional regulator